MKSAELDRHMALRRTRGPEQALAESLAYLETRGPPLWLELGRALLETGAHSDAAMILEAAHQRFPRISRITQSLAKAHLLSGRAALAEALLTSIIGKDRSNVEALWLLADAQRERGHFTASSNTVRKIADDAPAHADTQVQCIEWIMNCGREPLAVTVAERALHKHPRDARLRVLAGQLALVLGQFDSAREHLIAALGCGIDLNHWFVPQILAMTQRYSDPEHADFAIYQRILTDVSLHPIARASVEFGQAKLFSDVGKTAAAATALRSANALCRQQIRWSRSDWKRHIDNRVASTVPAGRLEERADFIPIFIVGLPRSGTTLIADRLEESALVRNRGESAALHHITTRVSIATPDPERLRGAEAFYRSRAQQDDAPAKFYIDKNPINFRYLDYVCRLFPQARVIYCRRNLRDTALSIFAQYFANPENGFAYDFDDIAAYAEGTTRLLGHWQSVLPLPILVCDYERLVSDTPSVMVEIREFLGLPHTTSTARQQRSAIATASAWQARQPIHSGSIGRWRLFAPYLPEMLQAIPDAEVRA